MSEQNYRVFWEEALKQIHDEYKNQNLENDFKLWFNMEYIEDTLSTITVSIPSEFMWKTMNDKGYVSAVQNKIHELTGQIIDIKYVVKTRPVSTDNTEIVEKQVKTQRNKLIINLHPFNF